MKLTEIINEDIKSAMKAREKEKLEALRAVKSAFLLAQTEKGNNELSDEKALSIIQKLVKQRKESGDIYKENNRMDLADNEYFQAEVIGKYLPEPLSDEEIRKEVQEIIGKTGAESMKDMGKVMGMANAKLSGRADGKKIAEIVKSLLS